MQKKVWLIERDEFKADKIVLDKAEKTDNIEILLNYFPKNIIGNQLVEKLILVSTKTAEEKEIAVQGVFVEIGLKPNSNFVQNTVELNKYGEVMVDCRTRTNIPGLFAAGDVNSGPDKQVVIAAGEGAKAVLSAHEYLLHKGN